jgi:DNA-binding NtrC family response regulator
MADFLARAGVEVLPYAQKHNASLYIDFVGARPSGVEVLSLDLATRKSRSAGPEADLVTDNWQAASCLIISHALRLKPAVISADPNMLATVKSAMGVATSHVPVIICGEIGAGKYNLARLIHSASHRTGGLFTMQCASLEEFDIEGLLGSLLGPGDAAAAPSNSGGAAIFLDEIGELANTAQLKLMQLLQAAEQTPWADEHGAKGTLRFIAATNRPLVAMVERGDLRRELYWRLNVFSLEVPPLRQRAGDVTLLARYFLRRANPKRELTPMALKVLGGYAFPGNILELENVVTRLAIAPLQAGNSLIDIADVRRHLMVAPAADGEIQASGWKSSREEARREMILKTIAAVGGNRADAARRLGITPRALQYHITKAGLSRRRMASGKSLVPDVTEMATGIRRPQEPL